MLLLKGDVSSQLLWVNFFMQVLLYGSFFTTYAAELAAVIVVFSGQCFLINQYSFNTKRDLNHRQLYS